MTQTQSSLTHGIKVISEHVKTMPSQPGVYRMIDRSGTILYIGKARNIAKRVTNYTQPKLLPYRLKAMISYTDRMEFTTTETEAEALLLEAHLIKSHAPRYNILLKDDKSYPYILITGDHPYPRIYKHRGARKQKGTFFGPFSSAKAVDHVISDVQKIFRIRPCTDSYFSNRTRPCMEHQIKRCSAPCVGLISEDEYQEHVTDAHNLLNGKTDNIQHTLTQLMHNESQKMNYEKAADYRDRIQALNQIQRQQTQHDKSLENADIIALTRDGNHACINSVFYRGKQHFGNQTFFPKHTDESSDSDILSAFLSQFYQTHTPPKHIYLSHAIEGTSIMQDALSTLAESSVRIAVPKQGKKHQTVQLACHNAHMALQQKMAQDYHHHSLLKALVPLFGLKEKPSRIEVYDNSHLSGTHKVGAMIVVNEEGFHKKAYRKFTIKTEHNNGGDDYAMMREVLYRRLRNLLKEAPHYTPHIWPDVLLIDGGPGQLSAVQSILKQLSLTIPVVAIAKGPDRNAGREVLYLPDHEPIALNTNDPVLYFLQRIRDESHRFVIGAHRQKRKKALTHSAIDDIPNIGPKRKKSLLQFFGSVYEIKNAAPHELAKVEGISTQVAQEIYDYFR